MCLTNAINYVQVLVTRPDDLASTTPPHPHGHHLRRNIFPSVTDEIHQCNQVRRYSVHGLMVT